MAARGPVKIFVFSLTPLLGLLLAGEAVCRVKFFLDHNYDWKYITSLDVGAAASRERTAAVQAGSYVGDYGLFMPPSAPPPTGGGQMTFTWQRPCKDRDVFSEKSQRLSPLTWSDYCFRGDRVTLDASPDEYRLFVLGGSTVEDLHPDGETMVDYVKGSLPSTFANRRVVVVNARASGLGQPTDPGAIPKEGVTVLARPCALCRGLERTG